MEIIFLIVGVIFGVVSASFFAYSRIKGETGRVEERSILLEKEKVNLDNNLNSERQKVIELSSKLSGLESDHKNLQTKLSEQKAEVEELQNKFTKEFENLANRIFEEKSKKFSDQNKANLDLILNPLSQKIKDFEKKVEDVYVNDSKERAGLAQQIKSLHELNQQMSRDATNLTNALKGQTKTQGNWGEFILESILEKSGLTRDREYLIQASMQTEDGKRLQPDVIIQLPENKSIVIDSKVSLIAYERFFSSDDDKEREKALQDHIVSLRSHVKNLSSKNYQDLYQLHTLDFVIMFVPIESALALAVQSDSNLFTYAFEQRILILSPSILLASLKIFSSIWQQEKQNQNALEIARQSGALYDKFQSFLKDLTNIGDKLDLAKGSYDEAFKKLKSGRGNLISSTEKIKLLGAKAKKTLPPNIFEEADLDDENNLLDN